MRIYLDSAPIIYLVEDIAPYVATVTTRLSPTDVQQVCSDLSRLECQVKPLRDKNTALFAEHDRYFSIIAHEVFPLTRSVLDQATIIRAEYGFPTPDAIHLAVAITNQCDLFLTNDHRLKKFTEIAVEII